MRHEVLVRLHADDAAVLCPDVLEQRVEQVAVM
jgi:hypothetical protein